jgi:hypothetical protein
MVQQKGLGDRVVFLEANHAPKEIQPGIFMHEGFVTRRAYAEGMISLRNAKLSAVKEHNIDTKALIEDGKREYKKYEKFYRNLDLNYNKIWTFAVTSHIMVNHKEHTPFVKFRDTVPHEPFTIVEMDQVKLYWVRQLRKTGTESKPQDGKAQTPA